ncbi:methyl-accepting chemotaxis protein [Bradyrhizobium huanghuaihaiense]|uniref:cache domain-containing protein n=1 Tax=Bradyrhizobium huanghuaihaiense TaxID=990078 RepID=UPI0021AA810A|nr:methyl-accepting chemotaxis protein [Bradyrhizobium sp. CB3035]UWU76498.1 methyl-accepting chemotaxis protein [Bradyrhizobium sp. CB3035]
MRPIRYSDGYYFFVFNENGVTEVMGPKPEFEGKLRMDAVDANGVRYNCDMFDAAKRGGDFVRFAFPRAGETEPKPKIGYAAKVSAWHWVVGTGVYVDDIEAIFMSRVRETLLGVGVLMIMLAACAWPIARGIVLLLRTMTGLMVRLATGDTKVTNPADRGDELGDMAKAVEVFRDNMIDAGRVKAEQEQQKQRAEVDKSAALHKMADELERGVLAQRDSQAVSAGRCAIPRTVCQPQLKKQTGRRRP